jgi:hypothetical protein
MRVPYVVDSLNFFPLFFFFFTSLWTFKSTQQWFLMATDRSNSKAFTFSTIYNTTAFYLYYIYIILVFISFKYHYFCHIWCVYFSICIRVNIFLYYSTILVIYYSYFCLCMSDLQYDILLFLFFVALTWI